MAKAKAKAKSLKSKKPSQKAALENLNKWNIGLAILLVQQTILFLILSRSYSPPVTTNYLTTDTLASQASGGTILAPATHHLFDVNLIVLVTAILLIGAISYALLASVLRKKYEADLRKGLNKFRWLTHIVGGGLVLITVALLNGISDFSTLLAIFSLSEIFGLFALLVESRKELSQHPRVVNKIAFVAFITPWLITAFYLFGSQILGDRSLPAHVYWLDGTIFLLFVAKIVNNYLHSRKYKRWADYFYMERNYMLLSFLVKSALAWQVFFAVLNP